MTALAANGTRESKYTGHLKSYKMKASTTIYSGSMVCLDEDGLAIPAAIASGNGPVVGMAIEAITSGASVVSWIEVQEGLFKVTGVSLLQADVGAKVFANDDNTIDDAWLVNKPVAGRLVEIESSTVGWVLVGPTYLGLGDSPALLHFSVDASEIADGDLITDKILPFAGRVVGFSSTTESAVTTAAKGTTLSLEIGATAITGAVVTLAGTSALGEVTETTAITAANEIAAGGTISLIAASTTTYIEGRFGIDVLIERI